MFAFGGNRYSEFRIKRKKERKEHRNKLSSFDQNLRDKSIFSKTYNTEKLAMSPFEFYESSRINQVNGPRKRGHCLRGRGQGCCDDSTKALGKKHYDGGRGKTFSLLRDIIDGRPLKAC